MFTRRHTASRIEKVKKAHRTDIPSSAWDASHYAETDLCDRLKVIDESAPGFEPVDIVQASCLDQDEFMGRYARKCKPVIIRGAFEHWPAVKEGLWSFESLSKRFKHTLFKVGEDDHGRKLKIKMKTFMDYMSHQKDDSPLYLFESGMIGETGSIRQEYQVPVYFPDDYLNLVGRENKPPHRWYVIPAFFRYPN